MELSQGAAAMPVVEIPIPPDMGTHLEAFTAQTDAMLVDLREQTGRYLVAALAKMPAAERRLFRYRLGPVTTEVRHDDRVGNRLTLVAYCDPPTTWTVEPGSVDDDVPALLSAALVLAGAGPCMFSDGDEPCMVALCDHCHPETWAEPEGANV